MVTSSVYLKEKNKNHQHKTNVFKVGEWLNKQGYLVLGKEYDADSRRNLLDTAAG